MILHLGMSRRQGQPQHHMPEMLLVATGSSGCSFLPSIGSLSIFGKELRGFVKELAFAILPYSFFPIIFLSYFISLMWFLKEMRIKLPHSFSISPEIAFEPVGQFLRNLTARHKSQIHQALAH